MKRTRLPFSEKILQKTPTGIKGLDEITGGGLPKGRPTLICGGAGCGKTLLSMEFLVRGATEFNEPGVMMAFEETEAELVSNVASLGFDLDDLVRQKKLAIDYVYIERSEIEETGEYDLEGLFIRLEHAIDSIKAKRVVLDTIESLFAGFSNPLMLRAELRRLFRWLKQKGVTAIITGERGDNTYTRQGLEEYVSDCVILLDHRVVEQTSTRRLRIVKYRGSAHGTNEYPFLIDEHGFSVLPITSLGLNSTVSNDRISSGVPALDAMLDGKGFYRGSSILVSGTAGVGKSSLAAHFADAACRRGERVLYFSFEESQDQIVRNMRSIGIDFLPWITKRLFELHSTRPTFYGLEMHLASMIKAVETFAPQIVIMDPINTFVVGDNAIDVKTMLMRLVDYLKMKGITAFFTTLTSGSDMLEHTDVAISSLIDTWILLRDIEISGERNRGVYVLKSRGMVHSNQIREFILTDHGVELREIYAGMGGVLTGSARLAQEAKENAEAQRRKTEVERLERSLERKRKALEAHIAALHADYAAEETEILKLIDSEERAADQFDKDRMMVAARRDSGHALSRTNGKGRR